MPEEQVAAKQCQRQVTSRVRWWVWLLGPATFSVVVASVIARPIFLELPDGLSLGCVTFLYQLIAALLFLSTVLEFREQIRSVAWWILLAYWAGIGGIFVAFKFELDRDFVMGCGWTCLASAALMPLASFAGWARSRMSRRVSEAVGLTPHARLPNKAMQADERRNGARG